MEILSCFWTHDNTEVEDSLVRISSHHLCILTLPQTSQDDTGDWICHLEMRCLHGDDCQHSHNASQHVILDVVSNETFAAIPSQVIPSAKQHKSDYIFRTSTILIQAMNKISHSWSDQTKILMFVRLPRMILS